MRDDHRQPVVWRTGLSVQANVIGALLMRELHTRYGRENVGYLWLFLEPMMLGLTVGLLHLGSAVHFGSDIRPVPFAVVGYCIFIIFRGIFNRAEATLEANRPLLYHRMVTIFDMLFARALLEGAGVGITMMVLLVLSWAVGVGNLPARPVPLLAAALLMTWFSFAVSMLICAGTHERRTAGRLVHPASYILMPISGAFYVVEWLPEPYRTYVSWFPMTQIFELARYGQFADSTTEYFHPVYVCLWCLVLTYLGMLSIRITRRHVHLQ